MPRSLPPERYSLRKTPMVLDTPSPLSPRLSTTRNNGMKSMTKNY
jgi:hypothetical protein